MCNKLFLSHSSEDLRIVTAFVNFMATPHNCQTSKNMI